MGHRCEKRIRTDQGFLSIRKSVDIAVPVERIRSRNDFLGVGQTVAVGVLVKRIGSERNLLSVREPITVRVRKCGIGAMDQDLLPERQSVLVVVRQTIGRVQRIRCMGVLPTIREMVAFAGDAIEILPGAGITLQNVDKVVAATGSIRMAILALDASLKLKL